MSSPPQFVAPDAPARRGARSHDDANGCRRCSCIPMAPAVRRGPAETGIVTERDVLRALAKDGAAALDQPVSALASRPLAAVPADAFCYLAVSRMNRLGIRHLGVTDEQGFVVGALSARDLLRLRGEDAISLGDEIEEADSVPELARAWAQAAAGRRRADRRRGVRAPDRRGGLAPVVRADARAPPCWPSSACATAARAVRRAPTRSRCSAPPAAARACWRWTRTTRWCSRRAQPDGAEDAWFKQLAGHVADILHEVGVPYCKGGVMAQEPAMARLGGDLARAHRQLDRALQSAGPAVGRHLLRHAGRARRRRAGRRALARRPSMRPRARRASPSCWPTPRARSSPASRCFGGFKTEQGRIDLKKSGLFGIVSAARALAICHHVVERSTPARLAGIKALGIGGERDLDALAEAQGTFLDLMAAQQVEDAERGHRAVERGAGQAAVAPRSRTAALGARSRRPPR